MSKEKWEHRGTATVRLAGEDIEKIFREGGSAWILDWFTGLQKSARLSEIKSEPNEVDGGPPTLVLAFTVPFDEEDTKAVINFLGSTERERTKTIAAAALEQVLFWLMEGALGEIEEEEENDIVVMGDNPAADELNAIVDVMIKRQHREIDKSFARAAALLKKGSSREALIDLAADDICGTDD